MFSQDMILKAVAGLAVNYFKKNPDKKLKVSMKQVTDYISENYKQFKVEVTTESNDTVLVLGLNEIDKK